MATPFQRVELACARRTFTFDYTTCTEDELRRFFEAKLRRTARKNITKKGLIQQLKAYDKHATFQFHLLPPELRVLVYEYLPFQREILVTSKQAKKEALPVLQKASIVTKVTLDARPAQAFAASGTTPLFATLGDRRLVPSVQVDNGDWQPMRKTVKPGVTIRTLAEQMAELPKQIGQATHLAVHVNLTHEFVDEVSHLIYLLATLLNSVPSQREVEVILNIPASENVSSSIQEVLFATSRMGPRVFVRYRNFPKQAERALRAEMKRSNTAPTLLFRCLIKLQMEIEADKALLRQAGMAAFQHVTALSFLRTIQLRTCGGLRNAYADREELIGGEVALWQRDVFRELREKAVGILAERMKVEAEAETRRKAARRESDVLRSGQEAETDVGGA